MEQQQVEQAVARFINFMANSAEGAAEMAKKGIDASMDFGSELIQQVLIFNGIKAGIVALVAFAVSLFLAKFVVKNIRLLSARQAQVSLAALMPDYELPHDGDVRYVLTKRGAIVRVSHVDSDGDGSKLGAGYVWARDIAARFTPEQYRQYQQALATNRENAPDRSILAGIHEATSGTVSTGILGFTTLVAVLSAIGGFESLVELIKITVAPYLYLMEYAIELKDKV